MSDPQQDGKRIHRYRSKIVSMKRLASIDRGEAVNLARKAWDENLSVTREGILALAYAVIQMDEALRQIVAQDQADDISQP